MDATQRVLQRVIEIAARQVNVPSAQVTRESHFINDLGFDSLDVMDMNMLLEDEFDLNIPDDQISNLMTVGALADYISQHRGKTLAADKTG
jgi:acyl carrier protein